MLDKTITSALYRLRVKIIREGLEGLPHVEALLALRGVRLTKVQPQMLDDRRHCRGVQLLILASLRDGPKTPTQIAADFMAAKPGLELSRALIRVYRTIYKLRDKGVVQREGRLWGLVQ